MKIVILTGNATRHKFLANSLVEQATDALVVTECGESDALSVDRANDSMPPVIREHFHLRYETEKELLKGNNFFEAKTLPLLCKEVNLPCVFETIKNFRPDVIFVFGSSIIKDPLLSLLPPGRFINLHLGLSPYYRGAGTNFWPFVNKELECVGSTILHIDAGVDTGDIIAHVRPQIELGDNVHTIGCKVIKESVSCLLKIMDMLKEGEELPRTKQWEVADERYYRKKDFEEKALLTYLNNLKEGLIEDYLDKPKKELKFMNLVSKNEYS